MKFKVFDLLQLQGLFKKSIWLWTKHKYLGQGLEKLKEKIQRKVEQMQAWPLPHTGGWVS